MTTVDSILIGMVLTLVGIGVFVGLREVWSILKVIPELKKSMTALNVSTSQLVSAATAIAQELAYMRTLTTQNRPNSGQDINPFEAPPRGGLPPFPTPMMERFRTAPDAELDDTDMVSLEQTDADMADMEAIEKLRAQGVQIHEPDVVRPGVMVESE